MKSFARKVAELFALWIVLATILFIVVWLIVPQLGALANDNQPVSAVHHQEA
ncbi:hypothetical protein QZM35_17355 [Burkholderia sp. AU45274]|uniref:hypothetical protein n=1 Tax=Burkholderia sp. AU45274 TaxID=3059205 RepID=UPI00264EA005|nr:hypothetical protein [Burkholderia sp. AU45274]MDN7489477.1 hypothetical protein [Burkholderia sp. AU45274]